MPVLRCTAKLLAELDDSVSPTPPDPSPFGDWYGHLFSIHRRKCLLFINEPTLFVCFTSGIAKAQYRQIFPFFIEALKSSLQVMQFTTAETKCILGCHNELTIGKTINRSTMGSLNNRVTDAKCLMEYHEDCSDEFITDALNHTPMKPIGYMKGLEKMKTLVTELMKKK
jgi:hypothetical protein